MAYKDLSPAAKRKLLDSAKARRERVMAAARAGGYTPQRRTGTGTSQKRVSKTGKTYYYQPWASLDEATKQKRLASARKNAQETRRLAQLYKQEHGQTTKRSRRK